MNEGLKSSIDAFNRDYEQTAKKKPSTFVCPITLVDEPIEIIRGHIISATLPDCSAEWVPQVGDVDGVFGSVESEFHGAFASRTDSLDELFSNKKLYKQARPNVYFGDQKLKHWPELVKKREKGKQPIVDIAVEVPVEAIDEMGCVKVDAVLDRDDSPYAFVSALQSTHLTMFHLLGYKYVFSYPGIYVRAILNEFYQQGKGKKRQEHLKLARQFFESYQQMFAPLDPENLVAGLFDGTVDDRMILSISDGDDIEFAWGIVTKFNLDRIIIFLPLAKTVTPQYDEFVNGTIDFAVIDRTELIIENRNVLKQIVHPFE